MKSDVTLQHTAGSGVPHKQLRKIEPRRETPEERILTLEAILRRLQESARIRADEYDFSPIGLVTLTGKGYIQAINITGVRMLLCKARSALINKPFLPYVARADFKKFLDHVRRCRSSDARVVTELMLSTKGISTHVQLVSVPVLDTEHQSIVHRTAMIDITERVLAQKALDEHEKRYRDLFDLSPDAIWVHCDERFVMVNPAAVKFFGAATQEDVLGKHILDFMHPDFRPSMAERLQKTREGSMELPRREERRMFLKNSAVDVEVSASKLVYQGSDAIMVIARDVSQRKQLEQEILNISEREQSRVGQDLHDGLCQELAGIAFLAEALKHNLAADKLPPVEAAAGAGTIANLVKGAIDEAHALATGMFPVRIEENGLMSALDELAGDTARRFHIDCKFKCSTPVALADNHAATHVYRIAQEAVSNAIKHGRAKSVVIQLAETGGQIILSIKDNGQGLLNKMKRPGMGLKTMNYRARTIGGLLKLKQNPGGGVEVKCLFPREHKKET